MYSRKIDQNVSQGANNHENRKSTTTACIHDSGEGVKGVYLLLKVPKEQKIGKIRNSILTHPCMAIMARWWCLENSPAREIGLLFVQGAQDRMMIPRVFVWRRRRPMDPKALCGMVLLVLGLYIGRHFRTDIPNEKMKN